MATDMKPTRREQRQQRRDAERQKREAAARRARTQKLAIYGVIAALVLLGGALAIPSLMGSMSGAAAQGTQFPNQGQQHINLGQSHEPYNSNPPTSGPHYPDPARWGVYDNPLPDETLVHNLEHGGIVVHYNCPEGCPELVTQLKQLAGEYRSKLILAPRMTRDVPHRITLTAWTWLDGFNDFDAERIRSFIKAHKDKGPELLPD
jgi:hypothetical protein